ncbi:uncharacterized protein AB675_10265 [Cyphellophora attinorum]|uniref:Uncharacterized protein n=1 Tax=Cyphellophora attinorum TaxID=1664694 RepID=A0A0N1H599_9EURO|nr:uncharacterized protein AB675_10265 [Phialophora attinorum]KPI37495.1 hypothetical protein AB675_10265 [Phialophora attinorum]
MGTRDALLSSLYSKRISLPKLDKADILPLSLQRRVTRSDDKEILRPRGGSYSGDTDLTHARPLPVHSLSSPEVTLQNGGEGMASSLTKMKSASEILVTGADSIQRQPSDRSTETASSGAAVASTEVFSDRSGPLSSIGEDLPVTSSHRRESDTDKQSVMPEKPLPPVIMESLPEVYTPGSWRPPENASLLGKTSSQPWVPDLDNHPELVSPDALRSGRALTAPSIRSEDSQSFARPPTISAATMKQKKWHKGIFGTSSTTVTTASAPSSVFSASGTSLLVWNELGAGYYSTNDVDAMDFARLSAFHVHIAAGGIKRFALVVKDTYQQTYRLEILEPSRQQESVRTFPLHSPPHALALSQNDSLIAAKYSRCVDIYAVESGSHVRHALPSARSRAAPGNHLVCFAPNSQSFAAATRYEPEKVITYTSPCFDPSKGAYIETANPTGFPGDNGLSSLLFSSSHASGSSSVAFLSSFTEKGAPLFLSLKPPPPGSLMSASRARAIRDPKGRIGTRVHHAALSPGGNSLVLLNQRNDMFWIDDCWAGGGGGGGEPRKVATVKRGVSVVKDVVMGMPSNDEVNMFWTEKGTKGILVTVGKGGGRGKPVTLEVVRDLGG